MGISIYLLSCFLQAAAPATLDASDVPKLLDQVAARYQRIRDYRIEVRDLRVGQAAAAQLLARGGLVTHGGMFPSNRIRLARGGNTVRSEVGRSGDKPMIQVHDGETEWRYDPRINEYMEAPAASWPAMLSPGPGLPGMEWTYIRKFRALGAMAEKTRVVKDNIPADRDCPNATVLLELALSDDGSARERMRIDKTTGLVCRSEIHSREMLRNLGPYVRDRTMVWKYVQIDGPVDPESLAFVPPKKARRVERFSPLAPLEP